MSMLEVEMLRSWLNNEVVNIHKLLGIATREVVSWSSYIRMDYMEFFCSGNRVINNNNNNNYYYDKEILIADNIYAENDKFM